MDDYKELKLIDDVKNPSCKLPNLSNAETYINNSLLFNLNSASSSVSELRLNHTSAFIGEYVPGLVITFTVAM